MTCVPSPMHYIVIRITENENKTNTLIIFLETHIIIY